MTLQATTTVEVDSDAPEKLLISRADFMSALANDVKPVSETSWNGIFFEYFRIPHHLNFLVGVQA